MKLSIAIIGVLCCFGLSCEVGSGQDSGDPEWPLEIERGDSRILLYQLQPESLSGDQLSARAAVSIARTKDAEPIFGAVWIDARVATDRDARTVTLLDVKVPDMRFPAATETERGELGEVLRTALVTQHPTFSLDDLIATLDPAVEPQSLASDLHNDPPRIVFVAKPTALITIDGEPQLREIEGSKLMRVVNTPFILIFDPVQKIYFLDAGGSWRRAAALEGPWQKDSNPPAEVTAALPKPTSEAGAKPEPIGDDVEVMVTTAPTELIVSKGEPRWTPFPGNELLYLANSENDVFLEGATHTCYVLLAGRWYSSPSLDKGSWTYVSSDQLPPAFQSVPADSDRARVRTFVAGTSEAREAVLDASIPQTTAVKRSDAHCSVAYDGKPKFEAIPGTALRYAVNTSSSVIETMGRFYCCSDGVWYVAELATGPWAVASEVPEEVYTIPPSCPIYPVRYVYVYDSTPDYVWVGYLPGYTGCYVAGSTIVYGTGYWYPGWIGVSYYPRPWTWGFCPHYDPWFCSWGFGFGFAWGVNPWWFSHSCGWGHPGWWGVGGFHGHDFDIHGSVVRRASLARSNLAMPGHPLGRENLYNREENRSRMAAVPGLETRSKRATAVPNNVFADREGNVQRRTQDGWEERQQSQWKRAAPQGQGPAAGRVPPAVERERPQTTRPQAPTGRPNPVAPPPSQGRPVPGSSAQPSGRPAPGSQAPPSGRPAPVSPPATRPPPVSPPVQGRPTPERPSGLDGGRLDSTQPPPFQRPAPLQPDSNAPFIPRQGLRPMPSPVNSFDRMRAARDRGNTRSQGWRQAPTRGRRGG